MDTASAPRPRRRNPATHGAILKATVTLLECVGYRDLTIEGIAELAGVGKQTIYRWWPNKARLVMEAFITAGEERVPEPDTGNVVTDLEAILIPVFAQNAAYDRGTALANKGMMAEAQLDPEFAREYGELHRSWWGPLVRVIERGATRGELRHDVDAQALVDVMLGSSWYRVLLEHEPLDDHFARELIRIVVEGNRPDPNA
jgi:AcrR family transcriptional regulator